VPPLQALIAARAAIKIKALAVDPAHRGHGVASALLAGCVRIYDQLDYHLLYGSFAVGSGLDTFYAARGFTVLPTDDGIPMDVILGWPVRLCADPTEQLFARWR